MSKEKENIDISEEKENIEMPKVKENIAMSEVKISNEMLEVKENNEMSEVKENIEVTKNDENDYGSVDSLASSLKELNRKSKLFEYSPDNVEYILAAANCEYDKVNRFLKEDPSLVSMKSPVSGYTALHFACKFNDIILVKALIGNYNADVNAISNGQTPLHVAVQFKHFELAKILYNDYNADKNIADYYGKKPVNMVDKKDEELVESFLGVAEWKQYITEKSNRPSVIKKNSLTGHDVSRSFLVPNENRNSGIHTSLRPSGSFQGPSPSPSPSFRRKNEQKSNTLNNNSSNSGIMSTIFNKTSFFSDINSMLVGKKPV